MTNRFIMLCVLLTALCVHAQDVDHDRRLTVSGNVQDSELKGPMAATTRSGVTTTGAVTETEDLTVKTSMFHPNIILTKY